MKKASIDLGTNTVLLLIANVDYQSGETSGVQKIVDQVKIVRLGEGVDKNRAFGEAAMLRTMQALSEYASVILENGLDPKGTMCVATSQARDSKNAVEFFKKVKEMTGFEFKILSGDEEAKATFIGSLLPGFDPRKTVVIDLGGGSTEFVSHPDGISLDIGSVRFSERFFNEAIQSNRPVTDTEFWNCQSAITNEIQAAITLFKDLKLKRGHGFQLLGVAGTITTLAQWHLRSTKFEADAIDQVTLSSGDLFRMVEELKYRAVSEIRNIQSIDPGRASVILAGSMIIWRIVEAFNEADLLIDGPLLRVSSRGLRYGVI